MKSVQTRPRSVNICFNVDRFRLFTISRTSVSSQGTENRFDIQHTVIPTDNEHKIGLPEITANLGSARIDDNDRFSFDFN